MNKSITQVHSEQSDPQEGAVHLPIQTCAVLKEQPECNKTYVIQFITHHQSVDTMLITGNSKTGMDYTVTAKCRDVLSTKGQGVTGQRSQNDLAC